MPKEQPKWAPSQVEQPKTPTPSSEESLERIATALGRIAVVMEKMYDRG